VCVVGGGEVTIRANEYTKFGQLIIIGRSLKYCHQMSHFKAKMHQIRFLESSVSHVRLFVRFCVILQFKMSFLITLEKHYN